MITETAGNLLKAPVDALVTTVNTQGVMGKGIALQFKKAYPDMFKAYSAAAKRGDIRLGSMHVWSAGALEPPRFVINFPTKGHWRAKSRLADIEAGLDDLVRVIRQYGITSIAVPPLGCGNGGLTWIEVEPRIRAALEAVPDVDVRLYPPVGAPEAQDMPVNTRPPRLSVGRAALVELVNNYTEQALDAPSLVETQKLMYFLQAAGEPLRLRFAAAHYGPYADSLRHVLIEMEGHYLLGFGDGSARVRDAAPLQTTDEGVAVAAAMLEAHPQTRERIARVLTLAEGYESAYGMELLATVHWLAREQKGVPNVGEVTAAVAAWTDRKARIFTADHVERALTTLQERGWLSAA